MPQPPNINKMLEQAQAMLAQQQEAQAKLKTEKVEATAGGGMVRVVMSGDMRVQDLTIDPDAVDPEDVEMLEDLILTGVKKAIEDGKALAQSEMGKVTGGMGLPPGLGF